MRDKEVTYGRIVLEGGSVFFTYLRRELLNRRRQTIVVALGLAIGIALVSTVSAISSGVKDSQAQVLDSLYGIGTDITITQRAAPGDGPPRFDVRSGDGQQSGGVQTISRTRLRTERGASTFDDATVAKITSTKGVAAVATALKLTNTTFEGELPTFMQRRQGNDGGAAIVPDGTNRQLQPGGIAQSNPEATATTTTLETPTGGADGKGGSAFSITEFSVLGITADHVDVGPMASVSVTSGRLLTSADVGTYNAVLDSTYATTESLKLDGSITIAGKKFTIVGLVGPSAGAAETASNVYIPIDVARTLASVDSGVTNIYVKATSGDSVSAASTALATLLPDATISTSADLAETVSGSLSTASDLLSSFGKWLSIIVIIVAFALAMLFTISGVTRRTREFGTLKALGWKSNKIVRQVMAESAVQGIIGGVIGAGIAFGAVQIVNAVAPTLQAATGGQGFGGGRFGGGNGPGGNGPGGGLNPFGGRVPGQSTFDVVLHAAITPSILGLAIGLAVAGGLLAGAAGGMRAARLRPAESLRSVA
jgi:ABC-type antimicrobial peptide transport system permease subunit